MDRETILHEYSQFLKARNPGQSFFVQGLGGVGKSGLLSSMRDLAEREGFGCFTVNMDQIKDFRDALNSISTELLAMGYQGKAAFHLHAIDLYAHQRDMNNDGNARN